MTPTSTVWLILFGVERKGRNGIGSLVRVVVEGGGGGREVPHRDISVQEVLQVRMEGGGAVRTEALILTLISYQAATVNGLLPQGAHCPGQEETLAELHPSFHFAKGRRDKRLRVWTWKTTV